MNVPDIAVAVPHSWSTRSDPLHGIVLAARARQVPPSGFAPEVVVRGTPVDVGLDAWRTDAMASLAGQLDGFEVEDTDRLDLGGRPVDYRRFSHRSGAVDVVCDQWSWVADGLGVTLTGSVAREDYAEYCDLFEDVAATVEIAPGVAA